MNNEYLAECNMEETKIYNLGILEDKTYSFALRIIKAHKYLTDKNEYILSKQLLRSGTSIGANCREATFAQSKQDFVNKLSIALKEADETDYWLELLLTTGYLNDKEHKSLQDECTEIIKMLTSIIKSSKGIS